MPSRTNCKVRPLIAPFGKRLEAVAEFLADGQLKFVAALPERFAELDPTKPFVARIDVKPFHEQTQP